MTYRALSGDAIVTTLDRLEKRIGERFPEAGLRGVAQELLQIARQDRKKVERLARPYLFLRFGIFLVVALGILGQAFIVAEIVRADDLAALTAEGMGFFTFFQGLEAALNTLILVGAGVFFLTTVEERWKRARALSGLHELRSIAHVIDMHQLTKDPAAAATTGPRTASSPERTLSEFELMRYLDYCTELLSLTAKIAALYAQSARDPAIVGAVNDLESMCASLSNKIWQKIVLIRPEAALAETDGAAA